MNITKCALQARGIGIWKCWFYGGRKTGEPGEKPWEQGQEPTRNTTHIGNRDRESNPGHIGGPGSIQSTSGSIRLRIRFNRSISLLINQSINESIINKRISADVTFINKLFNSKHFSNFEQRNLCLNCPIKEYQVYKQQRPQSFYKQGSEQINKHSLSERVNKPTNEQTNDRMDNR